MDTIVAVLYQKANARRFVDSMWVENYTFYLYFECKVCAHTPDFIT